MEKLKAILILSVVLPVSLLVTFRLTGILEEPPIPEFRMGDTVVWSAKKFQSTRTLSEPVESFYQDDAVSINFTIIIGTYHVYSPRYGLKDWVGLSIVATANTSFGFIHSMDINFSRTDGDSFLDPINDPDNIKTYGVSIWRHDSLATSTSEAHVMAKAGNQTSYAYLSILADWVFFNKDSDNSLTITLETTIFNGTAYIRTIMPIQLEVKAP